MFPRLPPLTPLTNDQLLALSEQMREPTAARSWGGTPESLDNTDIPSGYTYLGQFIDHDITFDPTFHAAASSWPVIRGNMMYQSTRLER